MTDAAASEPGVGASPPAPSKPRIVVIGAGFGGLSAARALAGTDAEITVIDRRNHHLFQPLLYQVATAGLSPADIASPIRAVLRRQRNAEVVLGEVTGIDKVARVVLIGEQRIRYDFLIVASGARHAYFGHDEWEKVAPGLKQIEDATEIRRRILIAFEQAESCADPEQRQALMSFVIVGGGPTGVELAGAIAELARVALARDFRNIDPAMSRILLVEAGPRLLASFPESLAEKAAQGLQDLGVELRLGQAVTHCDEASVTIGAEPVPCRTVLWAAGVAASPAAHWLKAESDRSGRVKVAGDLTLPGHAEIFVIGDTAHALDPDGRPLPGVAPVAKQQGLYVARLIRARLENRPDPAQFRYRSFGNLATIGRKSAVADFGFIRFSGLVAWLLWGAVHVYFLIGFRNRLAVMLDWLWAYMSFHRGARLIIGTRGASGNVMVHPQI